MSPVLKKCGSLPVGARLVTKLSLRVTRLTPAKNTAAASLLIHQQLENGDYSTSQSTYSINFSAASTWQAWRGCWRWTENGDKAFRQCTALWKRSWLFSLVLFSKATHQSRAAWDVGQATVRIELFSASENPFAQISFCVAAFYNSSRTTEVNYPNLTVVPLLKSPVSLQRD